MLCVLKIPTLTPESSHRGQFHMLNLTSVSVCGKGLITEVFKYNISGAATTVHNRSG